MTTHASINENITSVGNEDIASISVESTLCPESGQLSTLKHAAENDVHGNKLDDIDPSLYAGKKLSPEIINFLLQNKKMMMSQEHARAKWYQKVLPDGTKMQRMWIITSKIKDCIYCLPCLLFGLPSSSHMSRVFSNEGYSDWVNAARNIISHEQSSDHLNSEVALIRWTTGKQRIDREIAQSQNAIVQHNRAVVDIIIDCCKLLTSEMMSFRKSENTEGKFFKIFSLIAKRNADAQMYLNKVLENKGKGKKMEVNFLSQSSLVRILSIMRKMVLDRIKSDIRETGKISLIVDSTQDSSKMEATVVLLRYIEDNSEAIASPRPCERLVGIFTSGKTSGYDLFEKVKDILSDLDLSLQLLVGQSYDGAGNMRGHYKGMKTFIQKECPKALYTWCHSHRFALVVEKSVECNSEVKNFFGILEEIYTFMTGHRRHAVFVDTVQNSSEKNTRKKRLKRVATTRWISKYAACKTLFDCFDETYQALKVISEDKTMGRESVTLATGLKKKIESFNFTALLVICLKLFQVLEPVTVALQGIAIDLGSVNVIITSVVTKLTDLRTDKEWLNILNAIKCFQESHSVSVVEEKRIKHRKRFFDEMGVDEPAFNSNIILKRDVYFSMLDCLLLQLNDRFGTRNMKILNEMNIFTHRAIIQRVKKKMKSYNSL